MPFRLIRQWTARPLVSLAAVIAGVACLWLLRAMQIVFIPAALGILTALVMEPIDRKIRKRLPSSWKWAGSLATTFLLIGGVCLTGYLCWLALQPALDQAPRYGAKLDGIWNSASDWARSQGVPVDRLAEGGNVSQSIAAMAAAMARSLWRIGGIVLLAGLLMLFVLLEADTWRGKLHEAMGCEEAEKAVEAIDSLQDKLATYLWYHTLVGLLAGAIAGVWLWFMDVPFAPLWGFLFFVLNYIPNIGSIIAAVPPLVMALISGGVAHMLIVGVGLLVNEQLTGNVLTSMLVGKRLMISPAVTLISLTFWTWLWGIMGSFLTMPMTVAALVVMTYVPPLQPLALLASDTSKRRKLLRWRASETATGET